MHDDFFGELAVRAATAFASIPLTASLLRVLLTGGTLELAREFGLSVRTLHRVLSRRGVSARELRTWARREAIGIFLERRVPQSEIASVVGFRSVPTLQAFIRRELGTTSRALRAASRQREVAEKLTNWPKNEL